jgi:hypothetical protein
MPEEHKSFWSTVPGIITAIATLITAIGGFLVVLNQIGVFGSKHDPKADEKKVVTGTADQNEVQNLSDAEVKLKQMELEARLREMEQRLTRQNQSSGSPQQPFQDIAQMAGRWYFDNGAYWAINQSGVNISLEEYSFLFGSQILTAGGQGTVIGNKAFIDFTSLSGATGKAEVALASDGESLRGLLKDSFGNTLMTLHLTRATDEN